MQGKATIVGLFHKPMKYPLAQWRIRQLKLTNFCCLHRNAIAFLLPMSASVDDNGQQYPYLVL